nr:MFS transporter [Rhizobium lusitanum]
MLSTLITVMAVAPLLGPIVGGQVLAVAGWRAIFWLLAVVGLAALAALFTIPETLPLERRRRDSMLVALGGYSRLLADRRLIGYAAVGGFFYAGVFAYIAGTPFAFIEYYHVPPQLYGVLFALGIVGVMAANVINAKFVIRFGSRRLLQLGAAGAAACGVVLTITGVNGWGGLAGLAIPLFVFVSWSGLIVANSIGGALQGFPERAGAVSALVGALHYGCGIVGSAAVSAFADGTPRPLAAVAAIAGIASFASLALLPRSRD